MAASGFIRLVLFWGGNIVKRGGCVDYDGPICALRLIERDASFEDFMTLVCNAGGVDRNNYNVKVQTPFATLDAHQNVLSTQVVHIFDEGMLRFFLDENNNYWNLNIFLELIPINRGGHSSETDTVPSLLVSTCGGITTQSYDDTPFEQPELELDAEDSPTVGISKRNLREPRIDQMDVSVSDAQACPVSIMDEGEGDGGVANKADAEACPLSIIDEGNLPCRNDDYSEGFDVPISRRPDQIYNPENGNLWDMRFATKKELKWAVTDHSTRFARRKFTVTSNTSTCWKVKCKNYGSNGCMWRLCACYKSDLGCWTITKIEYPQHSCLDML